MIEYTADQLLTPLKAEFEREYGLVAEWVYAADEDSDGIKMLQIRLNVAEDFGLKAAQIRDVKDRIQDLLIHNEKTSAYFPHILFNLQIPADAEG